MKLKLFTLLLAVAASVGTLFASDTSVGGIWYDFNTSAKTAAVTYRGLYCGTYDEYSGAITIPASVSYGGTTYSVTSIGDDAFAYCSGLTSVTLPNSVTSIGDGAFWCCSGVTSIEIPNSVTSIGYAAFGHCTSLTSITIPNSVVSIESDEFSGCTSLPVIDNVRYADTYLIEAVNKTLSTYTIKNETRFIGNRAFENCTNLTSIEIPNSVTSIGSGAFHHCRGVTAVTCLAITPPELAIDVFQYLQCSTIPLYVPNSSVKAYKEADLWKDFTTIIGLKSVYTIIFKDWDGTILQSEQVEEETIPEYTGATPTRIETAEYTYTFAGWTPNVVAVTGDATYIATYTATRKSYTITWLNDDGSLIDKTTVEYGTTPTHASPTKAATAEYSYTFAGWSPQVVAVTGDATYTATFNSTVNKYNISVNAVDGSVNGGGTYPYGTQVTLTAIPNYGYHFTQWSDGIITNPRTFVLTQDTTFTAEFAHNPTITYVYDSQMGSVTGPATTATGIAAENITFHATPNYGYHFVQWSDGNTENPRTIWLSQDTTFTAEFAVDKSGTCGKNNLLQWTFADDGTLTISGSGELTENYTFGLEAPTQMQQLVIGNEVTSIGERAFYEKTTLQKLIIGSNVTSIGKYAFASINNRQLTSLVLPAELLTIGDYAFSGNTYVESIDFNAKLQSIGAYAFKDCYRVSEMTCLATVTPDLGTDALASINSYASLCVPAECLRKYKVDPNWGRFDLCELGASSTTTDGKTVIVEPSDNTAIFTWPTENNAGSYTLQITKDGEVFCTLVFNSNGQLTGIAFAPSRNGSSHAPAATTSVAGMSFTVTGLNVASKYAYRLAVTNDASEELVAYSGEFATTGYNGEVNPGGNPTGIEDIFIDEHKASKILRDGQIFILRGEKIYTLTGQETIVP